MLGKMLWNYTWLISYIHSCARLFNILITIVFLNVNFIFISSNFDAVLALMIIGFFEALKVWFQGMWGLFSRYVFLVWYELKA